MLSPNDDILSAKMPRDDSFNVTNSNQSGSLKEGRTQNRVLQPPGGRSSIQLGWEEIPSKLQGSSSFLSQILKLTYYIFFHVFLTFISCILFLRTFSKTKTFIKEKNRHGLKEEPKISNHLLVENETFGVRMVPEGTSKSSKIALPSSQNGCLGLSVSGNKFANGSNMNCGNVITDRPSSRVLQPPGGKSSIHFG